MKFAQGLLVAAMVASASSHAGPLSMEPRIGLASDYSSNPNLRSDDTQAETHAAVLLDVPVNYDLDKWHFSLRPSVRYSDGSGYSSLASNYFRADAIARRFEERGSLGFTAGLSRDSSLAYGGSARPGAGVRRDMRSGGIDWQHLPTERTSVQLGLNWSKVTYDQGAAFTNLTDYRYVSAAPSLSFSLTERDSLRLIGSAGRYDSGDHITASKDYNLQLGFDRKLSEIWRMSASAGYSRSRNSRKYYFGPFFLGTVKTVQNSSIYDLSLSRSGESTSLSLGVARSLRPTGFAFLTRQDTADVSLSYRNGGRWAYSARAAVSRSTDPLIGGGGDITRRYFTADLSAAWQWTEKLVLTLRASQVALRFDQARFNGNSTGVSLELHRQFDRMDVNP